MLQLGARQFHLQVLGAGRIGGDERQIDLCLGNARQLDFGLFRRLFEALQRLPVGTEVDAPVALELTHNVIGDAHVPVVAAQERVARGGLDLDQAVADLQDRDVKGPAAQVKDEDRLCRTLVQSIGQRRRRGLVDDAQHLQPGDLAGVLGRLPLAVVEIRRHRDHGLCHRFAQVGLGIGLELAQDHCRYLLRRVGASRPRNMHPRIALCSADDLVRQNPFGALHLGVIHAPPHQALDRKDRVLGIDHRLPLGHLPDQSFSVGVKSHYRGAQTPPLCRRNNGRLAAFHHGDRRIGRSQIDTYYLGHSYASNVICIFLQGIH